MHKESNEQISDDYFGGIFTTSGGVFKKGNHAYFLVESSFDSTFFHSRHDSCTFSSNKKYKVG
jgi:hypothetical protein